MRSTNNKYNLARQCDCQASLIRRCTNILQFFTIAILAIHLEIPTDTRVIFTIDILTVLIVVRKRR